MPLYKHGKLTDLITVVEFKAKIETYLLHTFPECMNESGILCEKYLDHLPKKALSRISCLVLLYHTGVRRSEMLERLWKDIKVTETHFIIDFGKRKKGGDTTPPIQIPRAFYGIEEFVLPYCRLRWQYDHIFKFSAWTLWRFTKKVLGTDEYPHHLRLIKLSKGGHNPKTASQGHVKSFSGIKSERARDAYLNIQEKSAQEFMEENE